MCRLSTFYMGLELSSPVIASSSGRTDSAGKIAGLARSGVGAVVMKSVFEEQFASEASHLEASGSSGPEAYDYLNHYVEEHGLDAHLSELRRARSNVDIPVIASIHCLPGGAWVEYAREFERAGADALEVNLFMLPNDIRRSGSEYEQEYVDTVGSIVEAVGIPVSVKLPRYFTNVLNILWRLEGAGSRGAVLYNRYTDVDVNVDDLSLCTADIFSRPRELNSALRWVALGHGRLPHLDLCVSTGVHSAMDAMKALLVGARAVQLCTTIYQNGDGVVSRINDGLTVLMDRHGFDTLNDVVGRLTYGDVDDVELYERSQFMKYFSSHSS